MGARLSSLNPKESREAREPPIRLGETQADNTKTTQQEAERDRQSELEAAPHDGYQCIFERLLAGEELRKAQEDILQVARLLDDYSAKLEEREGQVAALTRERDDCKRKLHDFESYIDNCDPP
ncbi:hypothetical protein Efla_003099 [Eimeria flavescens]